MTDITYKVKLITYDSDPAGYICYVFENLDWNDLENRYIMCVRYPNWEQSPINIDDEGFVKVRYVTEGVDTWYNIEETRLIYYKFSDIIFLKFIPYRNNTDLKTIIID